MKAAMVWLSFAGLLGVAVAGVGCAASQRESTIKGALVTVDGARDGFLAYDRSHEMWLTVHCDPTVDTKDQCAAKVATSSAALAAYQAKRAKIDPVFTAAYRAITAAWILNDDSSLVGMQAAITQLFDAVKPFIAGGK